MKSVKRWKAALSALSLALAFFAAAPFMSCSNASEGPSIIVPPPSDGGASSGGTTTDGQGGTQSPDGGSSGGQTQDTSDPALNVPLTLEAIEAGAVVTFSNKAQGAVTYKVNGGDAQTIASGETKYITLAAAGDKVQFFGDNKVYGSHPWPSDDWTFESYTRSSIDCSANCYAYGNIMSLIKSENFAKVDFEQDISQVFVGFFANNVHIKNKDGSDLLLPAATATNGCYKFMFMGCTGLTKAPALPATKLDVNCYESMFRGCSNLVSAPAFPATTLTDCCYMGMFSGCSKLESAPALPATELAVCCYDSMFEGCSSLTKAPALPATTLANWCYNSMFNGCSNLAEAPVLPAETVLEGSYCRMFYGCAKLDKITCLATDISAQDCLADWLRNVAATGTFTKAEQMHGWPTGENGIPSGWNVNGAQEPADTPLTLEAVSSAATVTFVNKADGPVWYKVNGGEKQTIASGETKEITLAAAGDKAAFYGNNGAYAKITNGGNSVDASNIACSAPCYVYGNMMGLVSSYDYDNAKAFGSQSVFHSLFKNNVNIKNKDGEDLRLPATRLSFGCYEFMFYGCSGLTKAPELPATKLAGWCYNEMFNGCSGLNVAPELPATNIDEGCYHMMFHACVNMTVAPDLPATTLAKECYWDMFNYCTSLTAAPELPATTMTERCYSGMFDSCSNLRKAPDLPATTLAKECYNRMFRGCSSLAAAPALPATTLAESCYYGMFYGCSSLANIVCLATDISPKDCVADWTKGVAKSGTFTKAEQMHDWPTGESGIPSGWDVKGGQEPTGAPLTLEAISSAATVTFINKADGPVWYKINGGEKQTIASGETKEIALAAAGDKAAFYGNNGAYAKLKDTSGPVSISPDSVDASNIACSAPCYVYGNVMSLVSSFDYDNAKVLHKTFAFSCLFLNNANIKNKDGEDLLLPATTLTNYCYSGMFYGCSSLAAAPALPATSLATHCYILMFQGCASLTNAPALPATKLAGMCYSSMFQGCSSLTAAPALPATTLEGGCYQSMFQGCSNITAAPDLPATTLAQFCYSLMFNGCTKLNAAPALPATTLAESCYTGMFSGCTKLTAAPNLPAITLTKSCYNGMFSGCANLTAAPALPAKTLAQGCYKGMFSGCSNLAAVPALPATKLADYCYQYMFYGCSRLSSVTCLATDISAKDCVSSWLNSVKSSGTFTKAASMTSWTQGESGIPSGWTVVDYQP